MSVGSTLVRGAEIRFQEAAETLRPFVGCFWVITADRDAVLQLIFTEYLFDQYQSLGEGQLTKIRARIVSREGLRVLAERIGVGKYLMMGRGEEANGGRERASTLSDAFEALIGAQAHNRPVQELLRACQPHCGAPRGRRSRRQIR